LTDEFGGAGPMVLEKARDMVNKGIMLAPNLATGHRVHSLVRLYMREHDAAEHTARAALELNRYDPECIGQIGFIGIMRGRPLDALEWLARAIRIDPIYPEWYQFDRSLALYMLGEYRQAAEALAVASRPTRWILKRLASLIALVILPCDTQSDVFYFASKRRLQLHRQKCLFASYLTSFRRSAVRIHQELCETSACVRSQSRQCTLRTLSMIDRASVSAAREGLLRG
jgi:tetratricopeptide (TPR) repeat protein